MLNSSFLVAALAHSTTTTKRKYEHTTIPSTLVLLHPLPSFASLTSQALISAKRSKHAHILSESLSTALTTPLDAKPAAPVPKDPPTSSSSSKGSARRQQNSSMGANANGTYEPFQVLRAIEKKDIMLLMEVRGRQFPLLVKAVGGSTPLVHAMRLGKSHRDIAILLTGAISRRVNDVSDNELDRMDPALRSLLRSIRANLKIAINFGLANSQTDLISSYLQVIIMSEGEKFLLESMNKVASALKRGPPGQAVGTAQKVLEKWVGRELKEREVASVADYVANATGDLVLLGLWSVATDTIVGAAIPTYYFARDDRILKALNERLDELKVAGSYKKLPKLFRSQVETAIDFLSRRSIGGRERVELLKAALDEA